MKFWKYLSKCFAIPRSLVINIIWFGFRDGIKIPILISNNTIVKNIRKGSITLKEIKPLSVLFGFGGSEGVEANRHSFWSNCGHIIFNGKATFGAGTSLRIDDGNCSFGARFSCNKNCFISCSYSVFFGNDNLIGWNVNIRDCDGHRIIHLNQPKDNFKEIIIGNHVWIASYVDILKGSKVADNTVIAYRSCLMHKFEEGNCIIGGYPARILQKDIEWEK